jgi:hypothetical protein
MGSSLGLVGLVEPMNSKRRWLLVVAIIVIVIVIVPGIWWWLSNQSVLYANATDIRRDLLKDMPPGSEIAKAEEILKTKGFQCSRVNEAGGWTLQGESKVSAGWPVYRRIHLKAFQTDGKLADIQVSTDLTGP